MRNLTEPSPSEGVTFPAGGDGRVSSLATGRAILAVDMAREGLTSAHRRFQFSRNGELGPIDTSRSDGDRLGTATIRGRAPGETGFSVPYGGQRLFGADLRHQLDRWVHDGIAEPEFAAALHLLLDHPQKSVMYVPW